jgi:hypothetical protein
MTRVVTDAAGARQVVVLPTEAELIAMVEGIKSNTLQIEDVPAILHPSLFARLQIAKNEAALACQQDLYEHLSDAIWALRLTPVMPEKEEYRTEHLSVSGGDTPRLIQTMYTHSVPLVAAYLSRDDPAADARRLEAELKAAERFWDIEERRLTELRSDSLNALTQKFQGISIPRDPDRRDVVLNEIDCEMADLQRAWVVHAGDLHARKAREIAAIRRQIDDIRGVARSPRRVGRTEPVRKVSFPPKKVRTWKLFTPDDEIHEELERHRAIVGRKQHSLLAAGLGVSYSQALRPRMPDGQPTGRPRRRVGA